MKIWYFPYCSTEASDIYNQFLKFAMYASTADIMYRTFIVEALCSLTKKTREKEKEKRSSQQCTNKGNNIQAFLATMQFKE
jgi:hypothetical protein